jgi:WD40 repeat protein
VPGAREALLTTLPRSGAWHTADVLSQISDEIERRAGTAAETFHAFLSAAGFAGERAIGPDGRPFALVNAEAVRLLSRTTLPPPAASAERRGERPRDDTGAGDRDIAVPADALPTGGLSLLDLLGYLHPDEIDPDVAWEPRTPPGFLRIAFGVGPGWRRVTLDLKEAAQGGTGPHGLLAWSVNSGKSELIRTLILGLALTHSPEVLNFLLIGFPSGVTARGLDALPHVSDIVTNPFGHSRRLVDALQGELSRRQELLRSAGDFRSHREYEEARAGGADLEPLPTLVVLVDEVFELLRGRPQFTDVLSGIGWKGRALGVHLLLVAQTIDRVALRQLEHFLSYRLCLRTLSRTDSEAVLGTADAYHLPRLPGAGYLMTGPSTYQPFRAAYAADEADAIIGRLSGGRPLARRLLPRTLVEPLALKQPDADEPGRFDRPLTFDRLRTLDRLLPGLSVTPYRGLTADRPGVLSAVVGVVRRPDGEGRPLWLNLAAQSGNVAVAGARRSGKSRFLCTLVASLALLHTPSEVQFHCLDFGGGLLTGFADLPHVGSMATERDTGPARHIVTGVARLLEERELGATGPEVFLVVDRWRTVRRELPDLIPVITDLADRGPARGIQVLLSARAWADLPDDLRDHVGVRLELRLEDPAGSLVDARKAAAVPHTSGRGLLANGDQFFAAQPRIDGHTALTEVTRGIAHLVRLVGAAWQGSGAPSLAAPDSTSAETPLVTSEPSPDDPVTKGGQAATTMPPAGSPADGAADGDDDRRGTFDSRQPVLSGRRELAHPEPVLALDFSPDGRLLATGCRDGNVRLWDRATGDRIRILEQPSAVREVLFHPDGRLLVTSCADGLVRSWDLRSGVVRELFETQPEGGAIALTPDGGLLAACTQSSAVQLWALSTGRRVSLLGAAEGATGRHTKHLTALAFSPGGRLLATASADKTARVWDVATARTKWATSDDRRGLTGVAFSPEGDALITASDDGVLRSGSVRLWSAASNRLLRVLGTGGASAVGFHPDSEILATVTDADVRLWDVMTGEVVAWLTGHPRGRSRAIAFSPDGRAVAAAGDQVSLWDVSVASRG